MKKLWEITRTLLRRHWDWCLFGITLTSMTCWATWYLLPQSIEPRFRLALKYAQPEQEITLSELTAYITATSQRCAVLKREVKRLRGIRTASPEEKQLEDILSTATWSANTESHIQYTYNLLPESFDHEPRIFRPFTERQQRIIRFGEVIDAALSWRSKEGILTALVAESAQPTKVEGFYTDYRDMQLVVSRAAGGYQVRYGGAYGHSPKAYEYDFTASRVGDTLTGQARVMPEHLGIKEETIAIRFDRGFAEISGQDPLASGTLVKLADLRKSDQPLDNMIALGAGGSSRESWEARENFLRTEVVWNSQARPELLWHAYYIYQVSDEALGGPRRER